MFIGHIAVGLGAKKFAPRAGLGSLMAAPVLLDLLWPVFLLLGWEQVRIDPGNTEVTPLNFVYYPFTHSLLTSVVWATVAAIAFWHFSRYTAGAVVIWIGVVSHWVLDAVTHRPDLPLYPGCDTLVGFGLWNSRLATMIVEGGLFVAGVWLYWSQTRPRDRVGVYAFWGFVTLLILLYIGNMFGPPPESTESIAILGLAAWLFVFWAWWFDKHRATIEVKLA